MFVKQSVIRVSISACRDVFDKANKNTNAFFLAFLKGEPYLRQIVLIKLYLFTGCNHHRLK